MDLTACTTLAYMHEQMRALKYPAAINAPIATDVSGLWYVCTSLEVLPVCYHPIATNYSYYISSCSALSRFTTGISFAGGTNFNNFASYSSLLRDTLATSGHTWPMSGVTTMDSAFLDSGITVLPEIGTVGCTAFSSLLGYGALTLTIPASYNFASATAGQLDFASAYSLEWIYATPPTISHSLAHNSLSTNALNDYFSRLPIAVAQTIAVTGNPGSATCNTTIATLKGWVVII
ncbi:MAG: hypothetical protein E6Q36_05675 [Chryseobacterium sp.]|nr:MAG: hypothetical protein E6Q36_05675 [Chryseobacterium sp.]